MNIKINTHSLNSYPNATIFKHTTKRQQTKLNYIPIMDIMGDSFTEAVLSNKTKKKPNVF